MSSGSVYLGGAGLDGMACFCMYVLCLFVCLSLSLIIAIRDLFVRSLGFLLLLDIA